MAVSFDFRSSEQAMQVRLTKAVDDPDSPGKRLRRTEAVAFTPRESDASLADYKARVEAGLVEVGVPAGRAAKVADAFAPIHWANR